MKEEIKRINKLVAEGKLSPEDAADLIDAFYNSESEEAVYAGAASTTNGATTGTEEPPKTDEKAYSGESRPRDPFRAIIDTVERLGKEVTENVDWKEVTESARTNAKKGLDALKSGLEEVSKGKFNINWLFSTTTREIRLPITIKEGQTLRVENGSGHVTIMPDTAESYVIARAKFRGATQEDAKAKADAYTLIVEGNDRAVEIKQPHVTGLDVDLEIFVAATPAVEVKSEAGHVTVKDTKNSCRINSTDGRIDLSGLEGQIEVQAYSGDVYLEDSTASNVLIENKAGNISVDKVTGNMNLRSASGNISIRSSSGKTIAVEAVSGDISIDVIEPVTGSMNVRTVNGNAWISIPDGSDARVAVTTLRGLAQTSIELEDRAQNDQRITGRLGAGNGSIDVSAVTGNVSLGLRNSG
ncbi:MAG: DUF4097 family beta strand repeat protein [Armatimonadetes bacterium]|nr:DUF4097 family beta strand repeat protein [Armatimonadota bacterium]MBS1701467.1 DUF4097 family beta strand repeat protein [Armatimonadota bacterium]MBS1725481.1 DUF4097 family beta strand repeat protein [Armatimonadota bacterium]